ncbi:hypothetical protein ACFLWA_13175, partial [Chloroflexota bacterium]
QHLSVCKFAPSRIVHRHAHPALLVVHAYRQAIGSWRQVSPQGNHMPVYDAAGSELADGQVLVAEVVVREPATPEPKVVPQARGQMPNRLFLPFVAVGW